MKKLFLGLALMLCSAISFAEPTVNEAYLLNNNMGPVAFRTQLGTQLSRVGEVNNNTSSVYYNGADGFSTFTKRIARVYYNLQQLNQNSSAVDSGVHGTGVSLPQGAVITDSYIAITSTIGTNNASFAQVRPKLAFNCGDVGNIYASNAIQDNAVGSILGGATSTALGKQVFIRGNSCMIKATVTNHDYGGGKIILFVEYVVAE